MNNLIQQQAPSFTTDAVLENGKLSKISLSDFKNKKNVCLFFYPLNFTFVCPSEILSFSNKAHEFVARNVQLLGISVDSQFSHLAWRNTSIANGGIGAINFPLLSDITKKIAKNYGVLIDDSIALRGTFVINKDGIIKHISLNDLPIGRNVDEVIRIIDAMQHVEQSGHVCPAGWRKGLSSIEPTQTGIASYLRDNASSL